MIDTLLATGQRSPFEAAGRGSRACLSAMASRSRTQIFMKMRDSMRTHKKGPRSDRELKDFKVSKNLLAERSDDEGSTIDVRVFTVPPKWVTLVNDMNSDISSIKIKRALDPRGALHAVAACCASPCARPCAVPPPCCATAVGRAGGGPRAPWLGGP